MRSNCLLEIIKAFLRERGKISIVNLKQYTSNRKGVHYGWKRKAEPGVIYHFAAPGAGNMAWWRNILFKGKICKIMLDMDK